jgi:membrane protein required for beta-lactamase induction
MKNASGLAFPTDKTGRIDTRTPCRTRLDDAWESELRLIEKTTQHQRLKNFSVFFLGVCPLVFTVMYLLKQVQGHCTFQ